LEYRVITGMQCNYRNIR